MLLFDLLRGICFYEIKTENTERFINRIRKKASLKKLKITKDNTICFYCFSCEAEFVSDVAKESEAVVIKRKLCGIPHFLKRLRRRNGIVAGCVLSVFLIFVSSLFVWEIRIEGNEKIKDEEVIQILSDAGFYEGMFKKKTDVRKVSDKVLINDDRISWLAINFDGTVAHVELKEAKIPTPYPRKENVNLVASANGIIMRVDAMEGGTRVNKGDAVTKGQLLVSAFVDKRTGGSVLRGARGFVWAKTKREFRVIVPFQYKTLMLTEKSVTGYKFTFLGKSLKVSFPFGKYENTHMEQQKEKLCVLGNFVLPVMVEKTVRREYSEYTVRRTVKEALELAKQTAKQRLYEISPGFAVADFEENYKNNGNGIEYTCSFEGVENIAKELEFELS